MIQRHKLSNCCWKDGADRFASWRVTTTFIMYSTIIYKGQQSNNTIDIPVYIFILLNITVANTFTCEEIEVRRVLCNFHVTELPNDSDASFNPQAYAFNHCSPICLILFLLFLTTSEKLFQLKNELILGEIVNQLTASKRHGE